MQRYYLFSNYSIIYLRPRQSSVPGHYRISQQRDIRPPNTSGDRIWHISSFLLAEQNTQSYQSHATYLDIVLTPP